jgi:hypothetical protein
MKAAKTYSIIDINDLNLINFSEVFQTSENTIRKSLDESEFVIKYDITPEFINNGTVIPLQVLSYEECLELMATSEWTLDS